MKQASKRARRGLFVTFEGTEGAGKSTLIREIAVQLEQKGLPNSFVVLTREPGGTPIAEKIREVLLAEAMDPWTEVFLYEAARAEHLARTIRPALEKGQVVLCDRYADSSLAYQAHARGLPWKDVSTLNALATQGVWPDLTVLLDVEPGLGLKRASEHNRFENEGVAFQTKVRAGFLKARKQSPKRWLVIKVQDGTPSELAKQVIGKLSPWIRKRIHSKTIRKRIHSKTIRKRIGGDLHG